MSNKKTIISIAFIALFVVGFSFINKAKAFNGYYITNQGWGVLASSTAKYVIGGTATDTEQTNTDGLQKVSYMVAVGSSTTPPTVCWRTQYSDNGLDWYGQQQSTTTYTENPVDTSDCWTVATTSASTVMSTGPTGKELIIGRKITVDGIDTQFTRTLFSINPGVNVVLDVEQNKSNQVIINKN